MGKQLYALTATRGIAAIWVVLFHTSFYLFPFNHLPFLRSGKMAVSYFFVLSGYVLCQRYQHQLISYSAFAKKRFARIYPLYFLTLLFSIVAGNAITETAFIQKTMVSAALIQAWFPDYAVSVNAPAWSLCAEMLFYALFPLLLLLHNRNQAYFAGAAIFFFIVAQIPYFVLVGRYAQAGLSKTIFLNPLLHLSEFLIGMAGVYIGQQLTKWRRPPNVSVIFFITLTGLYITKSQATYNTSLLAPAFMLLIVAIALHPPRLLTAAPLLYLGEISYSIYLLHAPLYSALGTLNTKIIHLNPYIFFYFFLSVLLVLSAIAYKYYELPAKHWINSANKTP